MNDDILESLPEIKFFKKCTKCGATDWSSCNMDKDNRVVTNCDKCPDANVRIESNEQDTTAGAKDE